MAAGPDPETLVPMMVVEDSDDDLVLFRRLLRNADIRNPLVAFHSADDAKAYLEEALATKAHALPVVIVTDLKMPGMSGLDFTAWIRRHPELSKTRVVMLTGSGLRHDELAAKNAGADCFFTKFPKPAEFRAAIYGGNQRAAHKM